MAINKCLCFVYEVVLHVTNFDKWLDSEQMIIIKYTGFVVNIFCTCYVFTSLLRPGRVNVYNKYMYNKNINI